jgi:hypothetical protein
MLKRGNDLCFYQHVRDARECAHVQSLDHENGWPSCDHESANEQLEHCSLQHQYFQRTCIRRPKPSLVKGDPTHYAQSSNSLNYQKK